MKILRVDTDERKIGLSRKRAEWAQEDVEAEAAATASATPAAPRTDLKGGVGSSGPLIKPAGE